MKKNFLTLFFMITFFLPNKIVACDLLAVEIGSDKSTIENIFGKIDDENEGDPAFQMEEVIGATKSSGSKGLGGPVNVYSSEKNAFCEDIDFGEVTIKGYIVNNKVGALKIEVENGPNNEESNKGLLNKYVQSNFGTFDTQNKNWSGYKFWNIGNKLIYYYKIKNIDDEIIEGVAVTSPEYFDALVEREN